VIWGIDVLVLSEGMYLPRGRDSFVWGGHRLVHCKYRAYRVINILNLFDSFAAALQPFLSVVMSIAFRNSCAHAEISEPKCSSQCIQTEANAEEIF